MVEAQLGAHQVHHVHQPPFQAPTIPSLMPKHFKNHQKFESTRDGHISHNTNLTFLAAGAGCEPEHIFGNFVASTISANNIGRDAKH